ncbi:helix-turn-helix domain-containing protein [Xanthobacter autotrophicus]|uniref:helix-turn-helix domain-containing protein n=1 Tax=Xanthobacter TaxID=279 RepID=UPI0024AA1802|nr:helix-turn-helix domain-containing protein [Xanthobacter autotrophicus]MDI4662785.1 helix-turn-helix domain-containing protein [Xanthobacter autotrophicus]
MPHSMVNGRQIKAARALLGWSRNELADRTGVTAPTVKVVEKDSGVLESLASTRARLCHVLEEEGVAFLNGGAMGVQLVPKDEGLRTEDLNASNDD